MRATVVGLVALPVAAAGLALAATVMGSGNAEAPPPQPQRTATASTGGTSDATEETRYVAPEHAGTAIDGVRPHLTVIDGVSTLPFPAPLPSILSTLSAPPADLEPLPSRADDRSEPAGAGAGAGTGRGQIRAGVDPEDPLGSSGSNTNATRPDDTDPRALGSDRGLSADTPPVGGAPDTAAPGGGDENSGDEDGGPETGTPAPDTDGRPPLTGQPPLTGRPPLTSPGPPGAGTPPPGPPLYDVDDEPSPNPGTTDRPPHPSDPGAADEPDAADDVDDADDADDGSSSR